MTSKGGVYMYPNFEAERARAGLTLEDLTCEVGGTISSLSNKLRGVYALTFADAVALKKALKTNVSLEELFEIRDEEVE